MSKEELVILKYINEYKQISKKQIYDHFHKVNHLKKLLFRKRSAEKYSDNSINGFLWYLEVNNDYIRETKDETSYIITDKGEIEAYSYIIERHEIWKNRIYGFIFGTITTLIGVLVRYLIGL